MNTENKIEVLITHDELSETETPEKAGRYITKKLSAVGIPTCDAVMWRNVSPGSVSVERAEGGFLFTWTYE